MDFLQLYKIGDPYNISVDFDPSESEDPTMQKLGELASILNGGFPETLTLDGTVVYVSDTIDVVRIDNCYEELSGWGVPYSFVCEIVPDFKDKYPDGGKSPMESYVIMDPEGSPLYETDMNTGDVYPIGEVPYEECHLSEELISKVDSLYDEAQKSSVTKVLLTLPEGEMSAEGFEVLPESLSDGLNRAHSWLIKSNCAILSAWRGHYSRHENDNRTKELQKSLRQLGYGVFNVRGCYAEMGKDVSKENSFLVYPLNGDNAEVFKTNIFDLSTEYEQDCFLYKDAGAGSHATLIGTNEDFGIGRIEDIGTIRLNSSSAENFTQAGSGTIAFLRGPIEDMVNTIKK